MTPAEQIKTLRLAAGLTQKQAAAKVGVYQQTWSRWETGERNPSKFTLATVKRILRGQAKKPPKPR